MVQPFNLWNIFINKSVRLQDYILMVGEKYSKTLKTKYLEHLEKVFTSCIHSTQYLPQLFTSTNAFLIL